MAEEQKTTTIGGHVVPADSNGNPQTLKYLGTDHHARKVLTGKFVSNVGPKNFGKKEPDKVDWVCLHCERVNRYYLVRCFDCMTVRGMENPS